jgi:hypothetical protein
MKSAPKSMWAAIPAHAPEGRPSTAQRWRSGFVAFAHAHMRGDRFGSPAVIEEETQGNAIGSAPGRYANPRRAASIRKRNDAPLRYRDISSIVAGRDGSPIQGHLSRSCLSRSGDYFSNSTGVTLDALRCLIASYRCCLSEEFLPYPISLSISFVRMRSKPSGSKPGPINS